MSTNILNRPEKVILGVCKQLALLTKIELVIVRIVFIIAACLSGVGIGVYLILYFVLINLKETNNNNIITSQDNQLNKVVNVTCVGGIIGLLTESPQNKLDNIIKTENANGWKVVQVIPSARGYILLYRLIILILTLFLYTTVDGYYVIMERNK